MPRKANKPPLSEWELRKEVIQSWMSQYPWNVVIEKMKEEHNFIASREQYDAQIRIWGTHKNLKKHEWRGALHRFDKLASRHQTKIRMRILDNIVSEDKLQRSRKRYCQSDPDVPDIVPLHVSFDILGADGAWSPCTSNEENTEKPQPSTSERTVETGSPAVDVFSSNSLHNNATSINQQPEELVHAPINESSDLALQFSSESTYRDLDWAMTDIADEVDHPTTPSLWDPQMNPWWTPFVCSLSYGPSSPFPFFPFLYSDSLHDLCFKRFQNDLEKNGIDLSNLGSKTGAKQNFGISNFVIPFLRDVADVESSLSNTAMSKRSLQHFQPRTLLQSFQSLLPGEVSKEQSGNNTDLIAEDAMLETNFMRLLVFSIVNGFAGLDQIPIGSILRFLSRHGNIGALFTHVLEANPSYVAKSLAENLFKVAIEAQENHIIKNLLGTRLLQINDIVCKADGWKLTALERVAQLRDLKITEVLLNAHADMNKTFESQPADGGPLKRLIDGIRVGETLSPDFMNLVQSMLQAGAKVHINILEHVIQYKRNSELAFCLLSEFLRTHDTDLISDGMLSLITRELEEEQACRSTERILQACESLHKGSCLQEFMSQVEWALVQSAKRGHLQVVQLLLPHSRNLHAVLSASLHSGRREVIDAVLARKPNLNAPAQSIHIDNRTATDKEYNLETTTPLAEAIRTEDDDLIHLCEEAGALDYLHLIGNFAAALAAAAITGNSLYIHKLFHHRPRPHPREMSVALVYSIQNGYDDIALELLKAGAQCGNTGSLPTPLFAAIVQRNAHMVRAILNAGDLSLEPNHNPFGPPRSPSTELDEAVRWGDRSIILDLHFAFPSEKIRSPIVLEEILRAGNEEFLIFLIDHNLVGNRALTGCLLGPIKHRDTAMVIRLIELGADPSDAAALSFAAKNEPGILRVLLEHIPRPARQVVAGLGTEAIGVAIRAGLAGLPALEVLLSSKVVDFRSFGKELSNRESPLGLAIRRAEEFQSSFLVVVSLLKAGCDPNSVVCRKYLGKPNMTALLAAIETKNINLVRLLLNHGAEVNTEATRGLIRTPLQRASELGCLEIAQLLLEKGADVNALPAQRGGGTALQLAAISGNCNLAAEILDQGADPNAPPSTLHGRWPIEGAAEHGRLDMIDFLFKATVYDAEQCKRAMKLAQDNGYMGCRDLIQDQVNMHESMDLLMLSTPI